MPDRDFWIPWEIVGIHFIELYYKISTDRKNGENFTLQLTVRELADDESARKVMRRYDCAHGFAHLDVYNQRGEQTSKVKLDGMSRSEAITFPQNDFRDNTPAILEAFLRD